MISGKTTKNGGVMLKNELYTTQNSLPDGRLKTKYIYYALKLTTLWFFLRRD